MGSFLVLLIGIAAIIGTFVAFAKGDEPDSDIRGDACGAWWFVIGWLLVLGCIWLGGNVFGGTEGTIGGVVLGIVLFYVVQKYLCVGSK